MELTLGDASVLSANLPETRQPKRSLALHNISIIEIADHFIKCTSFPWWMVSQ